MNSKQWVTLVVVAVVFAAGGFFGGMKYQASKTPARTAFTGGAGGAGGFAGRRGGAGGAGGGSFINGQVLSVNGSSITVKLASGGSQIAVLAPSTQYRKAVDGSSSDVAVGSMVTITGSANTDGSITAQSVQIRTSTSTPPGMPGQ